MSKLKNLIEKNEKLKTKEDAETLLIMAFCEQITGKALIEMTEADLYNAYVKFVGMSDEDIKEVNKKELMTRFRILARQHIEAEAQENKKLDKFGSVVGTFLIVSIAIATILLFVSISCPTLFIL